MNPRIKVRIRHGLDLPLEGAANATVGDGPPINAVALLGPDYAGLKPKMHVSEGDRVRLGEPLFSDKGLPGVRFTSPGAGVVRAIHRGPRRSLQAVIIDLDGEDSIDFGAHPSEELASLDRQAIVEKLLASGLWTGFRGRPYARIPHPESHPSALFITAMDSNPLAADSSSILMGQAAEFAAGVAVLTRLCEGPTFVCVDPGVHLPELEGEDIRVAEFTGPHPAGLVGTHMHFLHPVSQARPAWSMDLQDAIAVGKLFLTGQLSVERVIPLVGPMVAEPRQIRTRVGASLSDVVRGGLKPGRCRVISGSILNGHHATSWAAYLGRYSRQVTVLSEDNPRRFLGWLTPGFGRYSAIRAYAGSIFGGKTTALTTSLNGSPRAMVPIGNFEAVMPLDILPAPLLKALIVSDTDRAQQLGCLELGEDDLSLCSFVCPSKYDYGAYLRETLTIIEKEG
jgi:Na+-transporting NADH:ubiquinone oxidoreductase subunit A